MKLKLLLLISPIILVANTCQREGPSCHHDIIFKNSSSDTLIYALKGSNGSGLCTMVFYSNANGKTAEMYVIDPRKFNSGTGFYHCDSIAIKSKVLKHYELTLDDLKRNNFTITYDN
jgi:hypothetical protein